MIRIIGPAVLSGSVRIQGAKNSATHFPPLCLITGAKFTLTNVPRITSVVKVLKMATDEGAVVNWTGENTCEIDSTPVTGGIKIDADTFFHTSVGICFIPVLASRFKEMRVEKHKTRQDFGGDNIGSRPLDVIKITLGQLGIETLENDREYIFKLVSDKPFEFIVPKESFSASFIAVAAALFKKGKSIIHNRNHESEFEDTLDFLIKANANIRVFENDIEVGGPGGIAGISYETVTDKNDFVTWAVAVAATKSKAVLTGVNKNLIKTEALIKIFDDWNIKTTFTGTECEIDATSAEFSPVKIIAGRYPLFHTDWQPIIAPLLTQINGESEVMDMVYDNRMQHFIELSKFGAKYKFLDNKTTRVFGPTKLTGTEAEAKDVRAGAAMVIAGLIADGVTTITHTEHIERGYENLVGRLKGLGVKVSEQ